jgi:hypothetical protein
MLEGGDRVRGHTTLFLAGGIMVVLDGQVPAAGRCRAFRGELG